MQHMVRLSSSILFQAFRTEVRGKTNFKQVKKIKWINLKLGLIPRMWWTIILRIGSLIALLTEIILDSNPGSYQSMAGSVPRGNAN